MIKHLINRAKAFFRDVSVKSARSPKWQTVEKKWKKTNPDCAACGSLIRPQVHHITPFHLAPELELDPTNLITLCMSKNECHLHLGHAGSFKKYCTEIESIVHKLQKNKITLIDAKKIALQHIKSN